FVPPQRPKSVSAEWASFGEIDEQMVSGSIGIVDPNRFLEAFRKARRNEEVPIESLKRTLMLEAWLRHLTIYGVLMNPTPTKSHVSLQTGERVVPAQPKSSAS